MVLLSLGALGISIFCFNQSVSCVEVKVFHPTKFPLTQEKFFELHFWCFCAFPVFTFYNPKSADSCTKNKYLFFVFIFYIQCFP